MEFRNDCPRCGFPDTAPQGGAHFCPRCRDPFTRRRRLFLEAGYIAAYDRELDCTAHVVDLSPGPCGARTEPLDPRLDLWNHHSPAGLGYGHAGPGPAQLALALLAHFLGPGREVLAVRVHWLFERARIANAPDTSPLVILSHDIALWFMDDDEATAALAEWYSEFPHDTLPLVDC